MKTLICVQLQNNNSADVKYLYYGRDPIGEYKDKPFYCDVGIDKPVPFDTQVASDLKRLILKKRKFETSGINKEVKLVWVSTGKKRKIIRDNITPTQLNECVRRNLPKNEQQTFLTKDKSSCELDNTYKF